MKKTITTRTRIRAAIVGTFFLVVLGAISAQAIRLQVFDQDWLSKRAYKESTYNGVIHGKRGAITDRNKEPLAVTIDSPSIAAFPRRLDDRESAAKRLAKVLKQPEDKVFEKLNPKRSFVWLKRQATPRQAAAVREMEIQGVEFVTEHSRFYPGKTLAAQLVGFSGVDSLGLEGMEYYLNTHLKGKEQKVSARKDAKGRRFEGLSTPSDLAVGNDVVLTIDRTIQHITQKALEEAVLEYAAESGMAVVMKPSTGEVLALAHHPFFNPNNYSESNRNVWRNRAITDPFEPGSTMKMFSVAAAIDSGICSPSTIFFCENGEYRIGRNIVHDTKSHGWLSLQQIVKYSSNIGSVKVSEKLGSGPLYDYLKAFGFGTRTGISCPGETSGSLSHFKRWTVIDTGAISFGQGVSVSAIQLTAAASAIANDGLLMKPLLIKEVVDRDGNSIKHFSPQPVRQVIDPQTAATMRRILKTVITEGGTGVNAALDGYSVCGKTGTAQKIDETGTYSKDRYLSSFLGFVPAEKPALTILVIVDEPKIQSYGGIVAAPAFRQIALETLTYMNIPPDSSADRLRVSRNNGAKG